VLLVLLNDSNISKGHIPGKVFECLASGKKIICIGNKEGDTAKIVTQYCICNTAFNFSDKIETSILSQIIESMPSTKKSTELNKYSRENLTRILSTELNKLSPS
jgi:hypothetical protein